jgi:hypothetical protein
VLGWEGLDVIGAAIVVYGGPAPDSEGLRDVCVCALGVLP